jgi:hypothetical protein
MQPQARPQMQAPPRPQQAAPQRSAAPSSPSRGERAGRGGN